MSPNNQSSSHFLFYKLSANSKSSLQQQSPTTGCVASSQPTSKSTNTKKSSMEPNSFTFAITLIQHTKADFSRNTKKVISTGWFNFLLNGILNTEITSQSLILPNVLYKPVIIGEQSVTLINMIFLVLLLQPMCFGNTLSLFHSQMVSEKKKEFPLSRAKLQEITPNPKSFCKRSILDSNN